MRQILREELADVKQEVLVMKENVKELKSDMLHEKEERQKGMEEIEGRLRVIEEKTAKKEMSAAGDVEGSLIAVVGRFGKLNKADALEKVGNALKEVRGFKAVTTEKEEPNIVMAEFVDEDSLMAFLRTQNSMTEFAEKPGMCANRHKAGLPRKVDKALNKIKRAVIEMTSTLAEEIYILREPERKVVWIKVNQMVEIAEVDAGGNIYYAGN